MQLTTRQSVCGHAMRSVLTCGALLAWSLNAMLRGVGMSPRARQDGRAGWPSLPGFAEALAATNPPPDPHEPVSPEEMKEASDMKRAWNALDDNTKRAYRKRTMTDWERRGIHAPGGSFLPGAVDGHARVTWWLEVGRHQGPAPSEIPF